MKTIAALILSTLVLFCIASAHAVTFDWATVGNPGNAPDTRYNTSGYGAVDYTYRLSRFEVTVGQYTEFLNSVAASDPHGLYNPLMWTQTLGCKIERLGSDGNYTYQVASDRKNRPVNYVSFFDAMRFVNWLHNGQGNGDTETGVYTIGNGLDEVRSPNARFWIPSEDEWYKAAYHKNDGLTNNYWEYPTRSDSAPEYVNSNGNLTDTNTPFTEGGVDSGNFATYRGDGIGTYGIGSPYYMSEVGEWENSESPYGTYDQAGNVFEWNEAVISSSFRGLRGGSFTYDEDTLRAEYGLSDPPAEEGPIVGFRVATVAIPEPSTLLLTLGVAGALVAWRRRQIA